MKDLLLSTTLNTRDLGGYLTNCGRITSNKKFIRSDALYQLRNDDINFLLSNVITTIVDLRSDEEIQSKPCFLRNDEHFKYYHCKLYGGGYLYWKVTVKQITILI